MAKLVFDVDGFGPSRGTAVTDDRRRSKRVPMEPRPAKLTADTRDFLCVVRDASAGGLKLRLFHALPEHDRLTIEFDTGERHALQLVWQTGDHIGCSFLQEVDLQGLVALQVGPQRPRQPRLQIEHEAILITDGVRAPAILRDISPGGIALDCATWLMIDEPVRIESTVLPTLHAKVSWRRPPRYGLVFEHAFDMAALARICEQI